MQFRGTEHRSNTKIEELLPLFDESKLFTYIWIYQLSKSFIQGALITWHKKEKTSSHDKDRRMLEVSRDVQKTKMTYEGKSSGPIRKKKETCLFILILFTG